MLPKKRKVDAAVTATADRAEVSAKVVPRQAADMWKLTVWPEEASH